jgi:hypothetical protein
MTLKILRRIKLARNEIYILQSSKTFTHNTFSAQLVYFAINAYLTKYKDTYFANKCREVSLVLISFATTRIYQG